MTSFTCMRSLTSLNLGCESTEKHNETQFLLDILKRYLQQLPRCLSYTRIKPIMEIMLLNTKVTSKIPS